MRKFLLVIIIFACVVSQAHALFDSKKVKELEQENAALKAEIAKLKTDIDNLKKKLKAKEVLTEEENKAAMQILEKIATIVVTEPEDLKGKFEIVLIDFEMDSNKYLPKAYGNIHIKNNSKFAARVVIVIEVRGSGDKQPFIYQEEKFVEYFTPGETKTIVKSFYVDKDIIKAANGVTFNARIKSAKQY